MVTNLKKSIQASYKSIINEERLEKLDYQEYNERNKPKKADDKIARVEVALSNVEIPGIASVVSSYAGKLKKFNEIKKECEQIKKTINPKLLEFFDKFFNIEDALITRVIKTAGYSITLTKKTTRKDFDKEKFVELIKQNFEDSNELLDSLIQQCTTTKEIASTISIEINESLINENNIKNIILKLIKSLKSIYNSAINSFKVLFKKIDTRLNKLDDMLDDESRKQYDAYIKKFNKLIVENEDLCQIDISKDEQSIECLINIKDAIINRLDRLNGEQLKCVYCCIKDMLKK